MKKFENISDFENLLKEQINGHSNPTPPDVWSNIASSTTASTTAVSQITSFLGSATNLLKIALFAGGLAAVGIVIYNENKTPTPELESTPTSVEEVIDNSEITTELDNNREEVTSPSADKKQYDNTTRTEANRTETTNPVDENLENRNTVLIDSSSKTDKGTDQSVTDTTPDISQSISVSNSNPCKGETIALSASFSGDWYFNEKLIASASSTVSILCSDVGEQKIKFSSKNNVQSLSIEVHDNQSTLLKQNIEPDTYVFNIENTELKANWFIDEELRAQNTNTFTVKNLEVGTHQITAKIIGETCTNVLSDIVEIKPIGNIKIFNVFTPNNDGKNDVFKVEIKHYENFNLVIFDKQGKLIFTSQNPDIGWNGQVDNSGIECENGEYLGRIDYKLKGEKPVSKPIRLTLKRP
ncbi:gliding motility-associated C-terminal domain-containing protein [Bacteroidia bacterium]|nr:gliding motility-associated C-terminal domain-containing protein [Bacteroidia bacterium]MDB4107890.1 gliding motility-associated C-terminal domain-containing protein [Bacteroidia bacterium]